MLTNDFLELEKRLVGADCPEYLFGPTESSDEGVKQLVAKKTEEFEALIAKEEGALDKLDGNGDDRIRRAKRIFPSLAKWALEKEENGTYGDMLRYRAKLVLTVVEGSGTKLFRLEGTTSPEKPLADRINAMYFEGYDRWDPVSVKRGEEPAYTGYVDYYGTHAAREVFYFAQKDERWPDLYEFNGHPPYLNAKSFQIGDVVEIETINFGDADGYINCFGSENSRGPDPGLDKALRDPNNFVIGRDQQGSYEDRASGMGEIE